MVDGEKVVIEVDKAEVDAFFDDMGITPRVREYTPKEQAIIIEGYRRGVNKDDLAAKLHTSRNTMRRWYMAHKNELEE